MVALVAGFAGLAFGFFHTHKNNTPGYLSYFSISWMENKVWLSGVVGFELKIFQGGDGLMKTSQREVASED